MVFCLEQKNITFWRHCSVDEWTMSHRKYFHIKQAFHFPSLSTVAQIAIRNNRFFFAVFFFSLRYSLYFSSLEFVELFGSNNLPYKLLHPAVFGCRSSHETIRFSSLHSTFSNLLYLTLAQRIFIFMLEQTCEDKSFTEDIYRAYFMCTRTIHVFEYFNTIFSSSHQMDRARWCYTFHIQWWKRKGENNFSAVKPFEMSE